MRRLAADTNAFGGKAPESFGPTPFTHVYTDRGEHAMKGFDDAVRLYDVQWQPEA